MIFGAFCFLLRESFCLPGSWFPVKNKTSLLILQNCPLESFLKNLNDSSEFFRIAFTVQIWRKIGLSLERRWFYFTERYNFCFVKQLYSSKEWILFLAINQKTLLYSKCFTGNADILLSGISFANSIARFKFHFVNFVSRETRLQLYYKFCLYCQRKRKKT